MKVFLTGATGFIGSAIVRELIDAGHKVLGLTRSERGAESLSRTGAEVHRGNLNDLDSLRVGAANCDGVIHCAFDHSGFQQGFSKFAEVCENDRRVIEALGSVLLGSQRPLVITSGTAMGAAAPGRSATEDHLDANNPNPRKASEEAGASLTGRGVNVSIVRLPQVHDTEKQGLITYFVEIARQKGVSAYLGEGHNRIPAAHVLDVARLYKLALEKQKAGNRYHAVAEEGIPMRKIAEAIGRGLKVPTAGLSPEKAEAHFGWMAMFAGLDMPASSAITRKDLGWNPTGPALLSDLENKRYSQATNQTVF